MDATKKPQLIELMDASGGANSVEYPTQIGEKQVAPESIGCMLKKSGIVKYPGAVGLFEIIDDTPPGPTLVGWWKGEDNLLDSVGSNNLQADPFGTVHYADGVIGRCFRVYVQDGAGVKLLNTYGLSQYKLAFYWKKPRSGFGQVFYIDTGVYFLALNINDNSITIKAENDDEEETVWTHTASCANTREWLLYELEVSGLQVSLKTDGVEVSPPGGLTYLESLSSGTIHFGDSVYTELESEYSLLDEIKFYSGI